MQLPLSLILKCLENICRIGQLEYYNKIDSIVDPVAVFQLNNTFVTIYRAL